MCYFCVPFTRHCLVYLYVVSSFIYRRFGSFCSRFFSCDPPESAEGMGEGSRTSSASAVSAIRRSRVGIPYDFLLRNIKVFGYELARDARVALAEVEPQASTAPEASSFPRPLVTKIATEADFLSPWFAYWCDQLRARRIFHRKLWELAFILQVLHERDMLREGLRGFGFGCGKEPIPSYLASRGIKALVTDLDPGRDSPKVGSRWDITRRRKQRVFMKIWWTGRFMTGLFPSFRRHECYSASRPVGRAL